MGAILCEIRRAEVPLRVDGADIGLSSIEELCYFMEHNLSLLDERFFAGNTTNWLRRELGLDELAGRIEATIAQDYELTDVIFPIMDEIGFLGEEEKKGLEKKIRELAEQPEAVRQKRRGDALAGQGKYLRAIGIYSRILSSVDEAEAGSALLSAVCNNMGASYARLFQMEEALSCMRRAYEYAKTPATLRSYLLCARLQGGETAYEQLAAELKADAAVREQIENAFAQLRPAARPENIDEALRGWVREYRANTGS